MRGFIGGLVAIGLAGGLAGNVLAQAADPPLDERQLTIHTLVREDVFAGWRSDDMERLARGERNIDKLLESRPESRAP